MSESTLRTLLAIALTTTLIGIALCAADRMDIGSWLTILGLCALIYGLHRFGRSGPDEPEELAPPASE